MAKSFMAVCFSFFWSSHVWNIDISHGSVDTQFRCGGIFKCDFVANLLLSLLVKEF